MNPIPGTFYYGSGLPVVGKDNPDGTEGGGSDVTVPDAWKFEEGWMAPGSYSAWRTQCMPIAKKITAQMIAAYNELVAFYQTQKPVPQLDVKGFKRKQELAVERSSR